MNGEGQSEKAINLIKKHSQFTSSDILREGLSEIYVQDERRNELLEWWNSLKSSAFSDRSLGALFEAQIALIQGSPEAASRALDTVLNGPYQDGSKALVVAKYEINQLRGVTEENADGNDQARMESTMSMRNKSASYQDRVTSTLKFGPLGIDARGVNFNIPKEKLNRPGVALPIGYFY
jgi:hypothetical protein